MLLLSLSAPAIAKLKEEDFIGAKGKLNLLQIKRISSFYTTGDDSDRDGFLFESPILKSFSFFFFCSVLKLGLPSSTLKSSSEAVLCNLFHL
ncbi:hypothetical protein P8452_65818 [Trifolium repens]|nr:hypothetical protein P8452_65818 [Trifolium repens]